MQPIAFSSRPWYHGEGVARLNLAELRAGRHHRDMLRGFSCIASTAQALPAGERSLWPRSPALPNPAEFAILIHMVDRSPALESLTAQERIVLMGRLWDSLDPAAAAPLSPALTAELARREEEADADPDAGIPWDALRDELQARLR